MKIPAGILALALLLLPAVSPAAELGVDATTLFRFEEQGAPQIPGQKVVPATQFFSVNLGKIADGHLSFHLSGWGRFDFAERSTNKGDTEADLTYGYMLYRLQKGNGQIKGGRFFVYDTGSVEQIDGVGARMDLARGFDVSGFAGKPVRLDEYRDNKGNFIAGGRVGYRHGGKIDLGISALHEDGAWSRQYNPSAGILSISKKYRELVGADIWLSPATYMEVTGRTSFDTVETEVAEHSYQLTLRPSRAWTVTGDYNEQNLQSYFAASSLPLTMFRPIAGTSVTSYGTTATYAISKPLQLSADYRQTSYRSASYGRSNRYGFSARMLMMENIRLGLAWHRLDSQSSGINSYDEFHGYAVYNGGRFFAALDLIAHRYEDLMYGKDLAFLATASCGYRVNPEVAVAGDLSYGWNPLKNEELRGVFKMNYSYETKGAR